MSHQIDNSNNRNNMAYTGRVPWHGLGQQVDPDSTIDEWRVAAGLDWHIDKRPIAYGVKTDDGRIVPKTIDGQFAHVRSDNQECIGQGSERFQIVQPGDTLEFFRDLVEGSRFKIDTCGALKGGAKIWALARANVDLTIGDRDRIAPYLLLATANDGTMSTVADFTTVRVVCNNTLTMAVGSNGAKAKIRVPHSRKFNAAEVKAQLGMVDDRLETFASEADTLAQSRIDDQQAIELFVNLVAKRDDETDAEKITNEKHVKRVVGELLETYRRGPGANLPTARGTAWGAVNAVTNYVDFATRSRSDENRFAASQFGTGQSLKVTAFNSALELVKAA